MTSAICSQSQEEEEVVLLFIRSCLAYSDLRPRDHEKLSFSENLISSAFGRLLTIAQTCQHHGHKTLAWTILANRWSMDLVEGLARLNLSPLNLVVEPFEVDYTIKTSLSKFFHDRYNSLQRRYSPSISMIWWRLDLNQRFCLHYHEASFIFFNISRNDGSHGTSLSVE